MGVVLTFREPPGTLRRLLQRSIEIEKRRRSIPKQAPEAEPLATAANMVPLFARRRRHQF